MKISNPYQEHFNITSEQQPLLDAMIRGEKIKEIVCALGSDNLNNPEKDFVIRDFYAADYYVNTGGNTDHPQCDLVDVDEYEFTDKPLNHTEIKYKSIMFYMHWVKSFKLY